MCFQRICGDPFLDRRGISCVIMEKYWWFHTYNLITSDDCLEFRPFSDLVNFNMFRCSMYGMFTYIQWKRWLHSRGNVGRYSLHGAFGMCLFQFQPNLPSRYPYNKPSHMKGWKTCLVWSLQQRNRCTSRGRGELGMIDEWYTPQKLIWNIIMEVWKISILSKWIICRFHVNLPGCRVS